MNSSNCIRVQVRDHKSYFCELRKIIFGVQNLSSTKPCPFFSHREVTKNEVTRKYRDVTKNNINLIVKLQKVGNR